MKCSNGQHVHTSRTQCFSGTLRWTQASLKPATSPWARAAWSTCRRCFRGLAQTMAKDTKRVSHRGNTLGPRLTALLVLWNLVGMLPRRLPSLFESKRHRCRLSNMEPLILLQGTQRLHLARYLQRIGDTWRLPTPECNKQQHVTAPRSRAHLPSVVLPSLVRWLQQDALRTRGSTPARDFNVQSCQPLPLLPQEPESSRSRSNVNHDCESVARTPTLSDISPQFQPEPPRSVTIVVAFVCQSCDVAEHQHTNRRCSSRQKQQAARGREKTPGKLAPGRQWKQQGNCCE